MDILAHGLWSYAVFLWTGHPWLAILFGILPDLITFGPLFVVNMFTRKLKFGKPSAKSVPKWIYAIYDVTHSFIVAAIAIGIMFLFSSAAPWFLFAWILHIVIDIPSHDLSFFPTPFLWPISDIKMDGISWGKKWFMVVNYALLLIIYVLFIWK